LFSTKIIKDHQSPSKFSYHELSNFWLLSSFGVLLKTDAKDIQTEL